MTHQEVFDEFIRLARQERQNMILKFNERTSCLRDMVTALREDINRKNLTKIRFDQIRKALEQRSPNDSRKYQNALNYVSSNWPNWSKGIVAMPNMGSIAAQAKDKMQARETRVVQKRTSRLAYTMTGGSNMNIDMPLRYNLRTTGIGRQDWEVLVSLPIKVHQGADAKAFWSTKYSAASFDVTAHGSKRLVEGAAADASVITRWTRNINDWWGKAAVIHHPRIGPESYYRLKFEFLFTDDSSIACAEICAVKTSGEARTTNPKGTIDALRWGVEDTGPGGGICHEVGHFIGCPDEYYTITYNGVTRAWGNGYQNVPNIGVMNNPNQRPLARHYRNMGQELARHFSFDPNDAFIILDTTLSLNDPKQRKHKLSGHIWD